MEITPDKAKKIAETLKDTVKLVIQIDGIDVFVTDILIENGHYRVEFFTTDEQVDREAITPHVEKCIMKLIEEQQCKESNKPYSQTWSKIRNIFRR